MKFIGWMGDGDELDCEKPWVNFKICLYSEEIGEMFDDVKTINRILKVSGYKIILKRIN